MRPSDAAKAVSVDVASTVSMAALRRHQLAYLTAEGWADVLQRPLVGDDAAGLRAWAVRGLPLVVTQQQGAVAAPGPGDVALGWPAPGTRRRLALRVPTAALARCAEFPLAAHAVELLAPGARPALHDLLRRLASLGVHPHVYGSHGWQCLSGLGYLHAGSDLDLWFGVSDLAQADRVVGVLADAERDAGVRSDAGQGVGVVANTAPALPRLDGELVGPDGAAVAWREFMAWRGGRCAGVLVKRLTGVALESAPGWPLGPASLAA